MTRSLTKDEKQSIFEKTAKQRQCCDLLNSTEHSLIYGGSRSGKTTIAIRNIILRATKKKSRHLICRFRFNHAKTSLWYDTIPKVLAMCFPGLEVKYNKSDWFIEVPNAEGSTSQIWLGGVDDKDRVEKILGNEYSTIYANECSQISHDAILMLRTRLAENSGLKLRFYYDCNPPGKKHWTYQEFVRKVIPGTKKKHTLETAYILINPKDNKGNLPASYIRLLESMPPKERKRFLEGKFLDETQGALWTYAMILLTQDVEYGETERTVVAVDPSTTDGLKSDEAGIVVASRDGNGHAKVEADYTVKASPRKWIRKAIRAYIKHDADAIVVETNQGGDMVIELLRGEGFKGRIIKIHAFKSKRLRAEPVSALYEQGLIAHAEGIDDLEEEMQNWVPGEGDSPNRVDALVYAINELLLKKSRDVKAIVV